MSEAKLEGPHPAAIIAAAFKEQQDIYTGIKLTYRRQFEKLREKAVASGVAIMDVWDVVVSDFVTALGSGKGNCRSMVFNEPNKEPQRDAALPHAERVAKLLVDAGFNAEAHIDNTWSEPLGTTMYQVVIHIGLR